LRQGLQTQTLEPDASSCRALLEDKWPKSLQNVRDKETCSESGRCGKLCTETD